jgi:hypothetical protein
MSNKKISQEIAEQRFKANGFELISNYKGSKINVLVKCFCGRKFNVRPDKIWSKHTKSCGCSFKKDLVGERFGKLVVIKLEEKSKKRRGRWWMCKCDCGNMHEVQTNPLTRGAVMSCGCTWRRKGSESPCWKGHEQISGRFWAILKCSAYSRNLSFDLTIEDVWNLFEAQERKCMLTGMDICLSEDNENTASLDRIDSSKGYCVENIQWVHKTVNKMKMDLRQEEFVRWCQLVAKGYQSENS